MSIVTVHGPNTWGSMGAGAGGAGGNVATATGVKATADPTNGWKFTFQVDPTGTRTPLTDFDWAFPGADKVDGVTATSKADSKGPIVVTYTSNGQKTATLTVSGSGTPNTFPTGTPNGTYPITVTATAGGMPRSLPPGEGEDEITQEMAVTTEEEEVPIGYDPAAHTVSEVQEYITEHPDQLEEMYEAEVAGKARSSLVTWMENQFPFDPGAWTVQEVLDYAADNPAELEGIIVAEQEGKNRSTLISQLEGQR